MIFSKRNLFLFLVCLSTKAFAQNELVVRLHGSPKWELDQNVQASFDNFVEQERLHILRTLPEIQFPDHFASMEQGLYEYSVTTEKNYKNRQNSCSFLARVKRTLDAHELNTLNQIDRNGSICIPGDLIESEQNQWMTSLIDFFWFNPWISTANFKHNLSLEEFIKVKIGVGYQRPQFYILTSVPFDGYGYNYSSYDQAIIANSPLLSKVFDIAKNYSPNNPSSLGDLGEEAQELVNRSPTDAGGFFILGPSIYMTNNWAPADLVELLVHEYGHVLQGSFQKKLTDKINLIEVIDDPVLNESGAEAVAWQILCDLYDDYPEIKFFHIFKLKLLSQWRKSDPHYMGAAAFANEFHDTCQKDSLKLIEYLSSNSLSEYMNKKGQFPLKQSGINNSREVHLKWQ